MSDKSRASATAPASADSLYRLLVEEANDAILLLEADGTIIEVNPRACSNHGYTREEMIGRNVSLIIQKGRHEMLRQNLATIQETGSLTFEGRHCRKDGSLFPVEVSLRRLPDGRLLDIERDITERKNAEGEMRRQSEMNRILVDGTSTLIALLDAEWRVLHLNPAVEAATGYCTEDVRGRSLWSLGLMDEAETARSRERHKRLMSGESLMRYVVRMRTKGGEWRDLELCASAIKGVDGSVECCVISGVDITDRLHLQHEVIRVAENEQNRIGSDLHDSVGQSLTGLTAMIEALEQETSGAVRESLRQVSGGLQTVARDVRRMSHGLSPAMVKNRGLAGALGQLADSARQSHRITVACSADETITTGSDEHDTHLFRIAQEAVNNALRHARATRLRLSLKRGKKEPLAELEIFNDGPVFDPGQARQGAGIGLRVMDYRANLIGGEIRIQGRPGVGVSIRCKFPALVK
jgi:PAS domain S-box-containing protein